MLARELIRNFYEREGSFKDIKKHSAYRYLSECYTKEKEKNNIDGFEEYLYMQLGYVSDARLKAKERYQLRKLAVESRDNESAREELAKRLGVNNAIQISEACNSLGVEPYKITKNAKDLQSIGVSPDILNHDILIDILKVYAYLIRNNTTVKLRDAQGNQFTFAYMCKSFANATSLREVKKRLDSAPKLFELVKMMKISIKQSSIKEIRVVNNTIYVPKTENLVKYKEDIRNLAFYAALTGLDYFSFADKKKVMNLLYELCDRRFVKTKNYLDLLDIAHSKNTTVQEIMNTQGVGWIDFEKQYDEYGFVAQLLSSGKLSVFLPNQPVACVIKAETFVDLLNKNLLKDTVCMNGIFCLKTPNGLVQIV